MSMTNPDSLATKADLHEMYERMYPYLGGGGSGGSGGHTIEDSTGTALTQRDIMQFSDSFLPTDDSTDEVTKIELNKLTSGEMDDIVTPLPSCRSKYHKYSTEEQIVGEWIDGSYIYEKTIVLTSSISLNNNNWSPLFSKASVNLLDVDLIINGSIIRIDSDGKWGGVTFGVSNSDITGQSAMNITLSSGSIVTLQYTKTTS